ncbi:arylsulfate sulfotransferase [Parabacteroides sp. PM5-20]|uniref:aryl-sulfate sulfotransferase n=1 Tax=unclassified Parabacteroides TaxID=2649774 RepID=UPI0013D3A0F7|nr:MULTISPECIES: aryl-sulfate sulfotransferase [unclassified Parabacteroides]MDH6535157.1 arylsulfate sulfotransferase [Parabacteroides sp. PM5-20]
MELLSFFLWIGIGILSGSCEEDIKAPLDISGDIATLEKIISEGNLLIHTEKKEGENILIFETDTLTIDSERILDIYVDKAHWKTSLTFTDKTTLEIPTLAESFHVEKIRLNPTTYAPLSARVNVSFPVEGKVKMRIKSKEKEIADINHLFTTYGYNHQIDIHGLYPDHLNTVYLSFTDKKGKERLTDTLKIQTENISKIINTQTKSIQLNTSGMEPGLFLISYVGGTLYDAHRPYMIDGKGNTRWLLALAHHPELVKLIAGNGFKRLKNGNFIAGGRENQMLYEINMMGEILHRWDLQPIGIGFHHDIIEMPTGNLLFTATKMGDKKPDGSAAIMDYVIELHRETGAIVTAWDLKQSLDVNRDLLRVDQGKSNWAHGNGLAYIKEQDAIILSTRFQGFVKLDRQNKVKWILSPQKGWSQNGQGILLKNYLLNPVDAKGNPITDKEVLDGNVPDESFEWNWTSHSPRLLPDGNLLIFDNGYMRHYKRDQRNGYSRAVIYKIDETQKTVQQVWQYGKERGNACYAYAGGSVQYLPVKGNILFASGMNAEISSGRGGRILEINVQNKEVVCEIEIKPPHSSPFQCAAHMSLYP